MMRAYVIHRADGRLSLVRTQDEAKPFGEAFPVDIPTSPRDAITFINALLERERSEQAARMPRGPVPSRIEPPRPMDAGSILARIDDEKVDQIAEIIFASKGWQLRKYAGAVAVAFERLGGSA